MSALLLLHAPAGLTVEDADAAGIVDLVREMHVLSDGEVNALEYAPLRLAFRGLAARRIVSLSGAGGEIARGFHHRVLERDGPRLRAFRRAPSWRGSPG